MKSYSWLQRERVLLSLKFLRNELINNLETKGYPKKDPVKAAAEEEQLEKERKRLLIENKKKDD